MSDARLIQGDAAEVLRTLPDASVQTCVTSPPYWGLRDYGTGRWEGGDPAHGHDTRLARGGRGGSGTNAKETAQVDRVAEQECSCGASRIDPQVGLESTPEEYVETLVGVFREVRRVLRDDGTLWLNLGDSYAAGGKGGGGSFMAERKDAAWQSRSKVNGWRPPPAGLKPKDLVGIPWRVAFALQADGWYLRSDIIWAKPNPMPESVTDRPTKSHEYVFLLSKSARYFYDADAIREPHARLWEANNGGSISTGRMVAAGGAMGDMASHPKGYPLPNPKGANSRTVWNMNTQPFSEAHFAVFPQALPERCIKAGSRKGDTVLDPFCGAGTTGLVADKLGRDFIGIELNPEYVDMARRRIEESAPLFNRGATA